MHSGLMRAGRDDAHQYILEKGARCFWLRCGITIACCLALMHHGYLLARMCLTRTAAERGPVLSGACGQGAMAEINRLRLLERANAHTPPDA